jgi:LacI family transcriptional regulator
LILAPVQTDLRDIEFLHRWGIPFVLLLRHFPDVETDYVVMDNELGGRIATTHLLGLGHRRIAHVAGPAHISSAKGRLAGYRQALAEAGVPYDETLVWHAPFTMDGGYTAGRSLLGQDRPSAIFASTDMQAVGIMKAAKELSIAVPGELALVGGDDIELAAYLEVPLTTFCQPSPEIAKRVVEILVARINGDRAGAKQVVLPPEFIVRKSSGASEP